MSNTSAQNICPKCGAIIPAEAPQGLCPKCLLQEISIPTEAGQSNASKPSPPSREELIAAFPQLEILELIGQGGMGFVFKARQPKLDRFVALKILPQSLAADPAFAERFSREGRLLARLNHPNIVTVHDFGRADLPVSPNIEAAQQRRPTSEFFYLLMEYVDGVNLRQAMRAGRFTPDQALAVVPKICEALQFAHNEGILHRDIKPENILLDTKGRVKIADFGIAKLIGVGQTFLSAGKGEAEQKDTTTRLGSPANRQAGKPALPPEITAAGKTLGTPNYMAPEQIERSGAVDHRADIYSLGVVFYEMLTGELPLGRFAPPSLKSTADPRLDDVVLRALEKEPNRRTQSAGEVKTQVETIATDSPVEAQATVSAPDRFWRRFAVVSGLVVLAIIFISVLAMLLSIALPAFKRGQQENVIPAAATPMPSASAETWSPTTAPGEKPDLQKILNDAKDLMSRGQYEESLQRQIWYHNHALEYDQGQTGVRLSFALSQWVELGRRYPRAKEALIEIRDRDSRKLAEGKGYVELFADVQAINRELENDDATYTLFKTIREKDPKLAKQCYFWVESLLVAKGEYQWCYDHMGAPKFRFDLIRRGYEIGISHEKRMVEMQQRTRQIIAERNQKNGVTNSPIFSPPDTSAMMKTSADNRFVGQVRQLIEILVATGHKADAETIRDEALVVVDDMRLKTAVSDAEEKVQKTETQSTPASAELLAEPPKLQFLAWQDEWKTNQPGAARHSDGSPVTSATELKWLSAIAPAATTFASVKRKTEPRFLHVWISHPLFDRTIFNEITLLDEQGQIIPRSDSSSSSSREREERSGNLGWLIQTFPLGDAAHIPARVTIGLRYTIGPLENPQEVHVTPKTRTTLSLKGGGQLNGIGQNVDGNAFVAIAGNMEKMKTFRYAVVAITKDGRELVPTGGGSYSSDPGVSAEEFEFDVQLENVAKFRIGTRPIRTVEWKNVVFPN